MKKSRFDLPHIKLLIAHGLANGHSQREIAQALDTSQPTISRMARHDDVRALVRKEEKKQVKQVMEILEKIQNDPQFLAIFQRELEKELLNFRRYL